MDMQKFFSKTPFVIVADENAGELWAGRPNTLKEIERILRRLSRRDESSLDILWANFGAGKTHTLFYLANRISSQVPNCITVIVELPEQIKNFKELYHRIARKLPVFQMAEIFLAGGGVIVSGDLQKAVRAIKHGNPIEKEIAEQWLLGERPDLRTLRQTTGINSRIESDADAADVLSEIIGGLSACNTRLCLMFDEFQRIGKLPARAQSQITSSLRTLLSKNPRSLSMFIAITSKMEDTAMKFVPDELKTIMGMQRSITLPDLSMEEALEFVRDRIAFFRPQGYQGGDFDPLGKDSVEVALKTISDADAARMIPRTILQALGHLYDEVPGNGEALDPADALDVLKELNWGD